jgi:outer membrane biosynthesis protein TonB
MPITQIPFQDPVAPPEKPQPEQLGLYDAQGWETAYRAIDDDARVPHLLIQLQDDLARSRRREAAWISIIVHLVLIFVLVKIEWFEKYLPWHSAVVAVDSTNLKNATFLELPPDLQKVPHKSSNVISDKNRVGMSAPQAAQQTPAQPSAGLAQNQPAPQAQQVPDPQVSQLQIPARPSTRNDFSKYASPQSAGAQIQQATRGVAAARQAGPGGDNGDYGLRTGAHGRQVGNLEILSDTQGVDFGPYLQRVLHDVRASWYELIPESAEMKKGKLAIEFAIMKDGSVRGLSVTQSSGDVTLDRPAYGSITANDPFQPLPSDFKGQFLSLRFRFYYLGADGIFNPDE